MANKAKELDVRDVVYNHLQKEERSLRWLSKKTDIPYGTLYSIFKHKAMELTPDRMVAINNVLGTNY